jgi:hypothetical protein
MQKLKPSTLTPRVTYGLYTRLGVSVGATGREVVQRVYNRFSKAILGHTRRERAWRKAYYRAVLRNHLDAQRLYHEVVMGL